MNQNLSKPELPSHAFYGLAGRAIKLLSPHTEADESALLAQFLTLFGNAIGRSCYFTAEGSKHHGNLFCMIVGMSGRGRKGSSFAQIKKFFEFNELDEWRNNSFAKGLSSGEGLIDKIKDVTRMEVGNIQINDSVDKRFICIETEFGNVFQAMKRTGNTLSPVLRDAWDGTTLSTITKQSPQKATDPHVSIIGHITFEELKTSISPVDIKNGLGNRFLFFASERSKVLPNGSKVPPNETEAIIREIKQSYQSAVSNPNREYHFSDEAQRLWVDIYTSFNKDSRGLKADLLGRSEAQIRRVALILAAINGEVDIQYDALRAAHAIVDYSKKSIGLIWGDDLGSAKLNKIVSFLSLQGESGASQTDIINALNRNFNIIRDLSYLVDIGVLETWQNKRPGTKPSKMYKLAISDKTTNETSFTSNPEQVSAP